MISITNKYDCCGCSACAQRCPQHCISMEIDSEGFLYPEVNGELCIHCNLCNKVCPVNKDPQPGKPLKVIAAINKNSEIRKHSSSGGVFTALAEKVISKGGVVFGARFDDHWHIIHSYTDSFEGLSLFRGSKYVQSRIGNSYNDVENFLKKGRLVLFSGTPCQIAGLKSFLHKEYEQLITVDIVCHGVPSPGVWNRYLQDLIPIEKKDNNIDCSNKEKVITQISFRDKKAGWRKYGFSVFYSQKKKTSDQKSLITNQKRLKYEILQQNLYMRGFLQHLYLRPSCHQCKFRCFKSGSDLTIADFWGIEKIFPQYDDDRGISMLIVKNQHAIDFLEGIYVCFKELHPSQYNQAFKSNGALFNNPKPSINRSSFWKEYNSTNLPLEKIIDKYTTYNRASLIRNSIDHLLLTINLYSSVKWIIRKTRSLRKK